MSNQTKASGSFLCIELLKSFSKKELQQFNQFINSPYFNTDVKLIQLFEYIEKKVLNKVFTEELQSKVYAKIFNEKLSKVLEEKKKKALRTKLSKLNQLAHQFLVIERLRENQNFFNDLLYYDLLERKQFKAFQLRINRDKKRLSHKVCAELQDFEHIYKIELHQLEYLFDSGKIYKNLNYDFDDILQKIDTEYLVKKLSILVTIFSDNLLKNKYEKYDKSLQMIEQLFLFNEKHPKVTLLYEVIMFLRNPNNYCYKNLLNLLDKYKNQIPSHELKSFYQIISNYFSQELRKGNQALEKDFTEIYFLLDNQNLLLENKIMPVIKLKNIVVRMCKSGYFNKAKYFLNKYIMYLKKEYVESLNKLCLSFISYYQKDYSKALDNIIHIDNINPMIESNQRILLMKIYFDRDKTYSEKTERLYRSTEKFFIDNKSLPYEHKKSWKNFTQILINLYRFKHNEGRMTSPKLRKKLEQQEYNADKKWLLEKMDELKP